MIQDILTLYSTGHPNPEHFVWEDYLQETGSTAAPSSAFTEVRGAWGPGYDWFKADLELS